VELLDLGVWKELENALVCKHQILVEKMRKPARLLNLEEDLTSHIAIVHLVLERGRIFLSNFFQTMKLHDCCFEGAAEDNSGIGTLTE
jgi:hypothetical protein